MNDVADVSYQISLALCYISTVKIATNIRGSVACIVNFCGSLSHRSFLPF